MTGKDCVKNISILYPSIILFWLILLVFSTSIMLISIISACYSGLTPVKVGFRFLVIPFNFIQKHLLFYGTNDLK